MRRRRKRNPGPALLLLIGGGVVAAGAAALALLKKKSPATLQSTSGASFATQPAFTTGLPDAEGILVNDCVVAVQGQAGFSVPGPVPAGENTILKVTSSAGKGATSVQAISVDPRVPVADTFTVPTAALSGAGQCP